MTHWELAIPFISPSGGRGTHFFAYPLYHYPEAAAAGRAAAVDAFSVDAIRHRRGAAIEPVPLVPVLRQHDFGPPMVSAGSQGPTTSNTRWP
ncbi:hypothetical protein [Streptomyces sp. NBC_00687]|uniref:hypothetical protein n=1 Tax=Streptomyces sp. NBC_00687 TaxID=2975807 RepID=UPI00225A9E16|nr:hypothetical protein [Streptomyces sp. NBC_00687]MCX4919031.1 hypothetical protein [Streptomyces sp. NBC_00687]